MSRQITSDKNYMKRHPSSGSDTMLGPNVERFFGSWYTRDYVIPHGIGEIPMFRAYFEPFRDGRMFEAMQDGQNYMSNPVNTYGGTEDGPTMMCIIDDQNLTLRLFFSYNTLAALSFNIHWVIYWDYGVTT